MIKHKDMLGRTLQAGQTAINVFAQSGRGTGERIGHRLCEIIKINPASVRIRYAKPDTILEGQSNIFHTTNRLIILKEGCGQVSGGENAIADRWEILDFGEEKTDKDKPLTKKELKEIQKKLKTNPSARKAICEEMAKVVKK